MDPIEISAASGLRARMESLEMLANNLANANTGGYKTDREFYSLYVAPEAVDPSAPDPATLPVIERHWTDFSQGLLHATNNPLDFALTGKGFFVVNGPSGPLYTRNGNFRMSPAGQLVTPDGFALRTISGKPVQAQAGKPLEVALDGVVRQDGAVLGQLEVVDFPDPSALNKMGNSYFLNTDPQAKAKPAAGAEVQQGKLEGSNVASAEGAVRLISVMRQFEMLQRAINIGSEMNRRAVEEVARVGS